MVSVERLLRLCRQRLRYVAGWMGVSGVVGLVFVLFLLASDSFFFACE